MTEFWEGGRRRGGLEVVAARYPRRGAGMTDLWGVGVTEIFVWV